MKVDHPSAAAFVGASAVPADLSYAARFGDHVADFGIAGNGIYKLLTLGVGPNLIRAPPTPGKNSRPFLGSQAGGPLRSNPPHFPAAHESFRNADRVNPRFVAHLSMRSRMSSGNVTFTSMRFSASVFTASHDDPINNHSDTIASDELQP
jgi:hypothetical protein